VDVRVSISNAVPADVADALRGERFEIVDGHGDLAIVGSDELAARLYRAPILALAAPADVIAAFAAGADDVVVMPADPREVAARAHAILRRTRSVKPHPEPLRFDDLVVDVARYEVTRAGRSIDLTRREFELLCYLLVNARQLLSKRQILDAVWAAAGERDPNVVETDVGYLRRKLGDPPLIRTVRQAGYVLDV
jgi:DNA-binding response OmpR family regulator